MSVAYIQVQFRLDFFMEVNNIRLLQKSDLGAYCLKNYRLCKKMSRREEQATKVVTDGLRVNLKLHY